MEHKKRRNNKVTEQEKLNTIFFNSLYAQSRSYSF